MNQNNQGKPFIYFDNAATTKTAPEVVEAILIIQNFMGTQVASIPLQMKVEKR